MDGERLLVMMIRSSAYIRNQAEEEARQVLAHRNSHPLQVGDLPTYRANSFENRKPSRGQMTMSCPVKIFISYRDHLPSKELHADSPFNLQDIKTLCVGFGLARHLWEKIN